MRRMRLLGLLGRVGTSVGRRYVFGRVRLFEYGFLCLGRRVRMRGLLILKKVTVRLVCVY